jgi:hypothetical protein
MKVIGTQGLASRIFAIALLFAGLAALHLLVLRPIFASHQMLDESLERTSRLASGYEGVGVNRQVVEAKIRKLLERQTRYGIYLHGETDALAAAKLQQIVGARIKANRGQIRSIRTLPAKTEEGFTRVAVHVQFEASLKALQRIILSFEANRPFVFVRDLEIKGRRRGRAAKAAVDVPLLVRLSLAGYMRPDSG